jgi:hypothetical protein
VISSCQKRTILGDGIDLENLINGIDERTPSKIKYWTRRCTYMKVGNPILRMMGRPCPDYEIKTGKWCNSGAHKIVVTIHKIK